MQRKLTARFRPLPHRVIVLAVAVLILLVLALSFWQADHTASTALVDLPATPPTRTIGPTETPPGSPPSPLVAAWPPSRPTSWVPPTPPPTDTPLPTVIPGRTGGYWAENLTFGPPVLAGKDMKVPFAGIEWSPDGSQLAAGLFSGEWIRDKAGNPLWQVTSITLLDRSGRPASPLAQGLNPRWSPDGAHMAYLAYVGTLDTLHVRVVDVATRQVVDVAAIEKGGVFSQLAWLSSSDLAFFFGDQPVVFDLRTGESRPLLDAALLAQTDRAFPLRAVDALPGKNLVALGSGKEILLLSWSNGATQLVRRIDEGLENLHMSLSPDGEWLAFPALSSRKLRIAGIFDPSIHIELPGSRPVPAAGNWSPDGASLLFNDGKGILIVNRDGSGLRTLPNVTASAVPVWSPVGDRIAWVDADERLWTMAVERGR